MQFHNQKGQSLFDCETAFFRDLSRALLKERILFVWKWLNVFEEYCIVLVSTIENVYLHWLFFSCFKQKQFIMLGMVEARAQFQMEFVLTWRKETCQCSTLIYHPWIMFLAPSFFFFLIFWKVWTKEKKA